MTFSLLMLTEMQLREIAESRVPVELAQRLEADALPPRFVASRALSLQKEGHPSPWCRVYLIVRESDQRIVGGCGFKSPLKDGRVDIGYGVSQAARRRGAATAAVRLLAKAAFDAGAQEVLAEVSPTNEASLCVVQKAGFVQAGSRVDEANEYVLQWVARSDG